MIRHWLLCLLAVTVIFLWSVQVTQGQTSIAENTVPIEFLGTVETVNPGLIIVDQLPVNLSTAQIGASIRPGQLVRVRGILQPDGSISAQSVELVSVSSPTPAPIPQLTPIPASTTDELCSLGPNYWKTHPEQWPVTLLRIGNQDYSQPELLAILNSEPSTDASVSLARHFIATQFNLLSGVDAAAVNAAVTQADLLLQNLGSFRGKLPYQIDPASSTGQSLVSVANQLALFNAGQVAAECQVTPVSPDTRPKIVIEGAVGSVQDGILTVNGLTFNLDRSSPLLTAVRSGDSVRIEGVFEENGSSLILIPTNVRIRRNVPAQPAPNPQPANPPLPAPVNTGGDESSGMGMGDEGSGGGMGMGDEGSGSG
jgi:hypothetical protein